MDLYVLVNATGYLTNNVTALANEPNIGTQNNASATVWVPPYADVSISKEFQALNGTVITEANYISTFWSVLKLRNLGVDNSSVWVFDTPDTMLQFITVGGEDFLASFDNGTTWINGSSTSITITPIGGFWRIWIPTMNVNDDIWLRLYTTTAWWMGTGDTYNYCIYLYQRLIHHKIMQEQI